MRRKFKVRVNGKEYNVEVEEIGENVKPQLSPKRREIEREAEEKTLISEGAIPAPMAGKILDIRVKEGDAVKKGDILIILEAMKMENEIHAPEDGKIKEIKVKAGDNVNRDEVLIVME